MWALEGPGWPVPLKAISEISGLRFLESYMTFPLSLGSVSGRVTPVNIEEAFKVKSMVLFCEPRAEARVVSLNLHRTFGEIPRQEQIRGPAGTRSGLLT